MVMHDAYTMISRVVIKSSLGLYFMSRGQIYLEVELGEAQVEAHTNYGFFISVLRESPLGFCENPGILDSIWYIDTQWPDTLTFKFVLVLLLFCEPWMFVNYTIYASGTLEYLDV